jgi:hypothetical protein
MYTYMIHVLYNNNSYCKKKTNNPERMPTDLRLSERNARTKNKTIKWTRRREPRESQHGMHGLGELRNGPETCTSNCPTQGCGVTCTFNVNGHPMVKEL